MSDFDDMLKAKKGHPDSSGVPVSPPAIGTPAQPSPINDQQVVADAVAQIKREEELRKGRTPSIPGLAVDRCGRDEKANPYQLEGTPRKLTPSVAVVFLCVGLTIAAIVIFGAWFNHSSSPPPNMKFVSVPGTNVLFSTTEVTNDQYRAFARDIPGTDSSWEREASSGKGNHPVVNVNYYDAVAFCEWLSRKDGKTYRLPTDHEWSCAVGIGDQESANATPFSKGEIADEFPWGSSFPPSSDAGNFGFPGDGYEKTAPVGSFRPNHLGIYDLGGNVSEWCQDLYRPDEKYRVMRGSNWNSDDKYDFFLSSSRGGIPPDSRSGLDGFRCVVEHSSR